MCTFIIFCNFSKKNKIFFFRIDTVTISKKAPKILSLNTGLFLQTLFFIIFFLAYLLFHQHLKFSGTSSAKTTFFFVLTCDFTFINKIRDSQGIMGFSCRLSVNIGETYREKDCFSIPLQNNFGGYDFLRQHL